MTIVYWNGKEKIKDDTNHFARKSNMEFKKVRHGFSKNIPQKYCGVCIDKA